MSETFLHGVEVLDIDSGPRPIQTVASAVIGIVGTAPDADVDTFPLNTPVMIAGDQRKAALLDTVGDGDGTLPAALDSIFDQAGAVVVVIRVNEEMTDPATMANVIGGVNAGTGQYEGAHALLAAESVLGVAPRILIAPGFTHQRQVNIVTAITVTAQGSGYTSAPAVGFSGGGGSGAAATAVLGSGATAGKVVNIIVTNPGTGYTSAPTIALTGGAGSGAAVTASGGGHIDVRLEAADSVELPVAALPRGVWDLRVRFPDTTVQTMVEGDVELEWDVSR